MKITIPLFIFFTFWFLSCKQTQDKISPVIESISESVYASGIVKARNQYQVYSSVNGILNTILVTEGDSVRKGDALMTVINTASKLNADNAKRTADFSDLKANADKLKEAKVSIVFAASTKKNDSLLFVRQRNLHAQGVGTQIDFEQRELAYKNAATNYDIARLTYRDLRKQLAFTSDQTKTNLAISNSVAGDYTIRARADGKVYKVLKEEGESASTMTPLAVLGDANKFYVELKVDEYDIVRVKSGQRVLVTMDSYKGSVFEARVEKIEPLMDENSRSFTVKATFVTKPGVLYPNLSLEANIVIRSNEKAMTIPRGYLIGDSTVVLAGGKQKKIITGIKDYQKVEVTSGLTLKDVLYKPLQ